MPSIEKRLAALLERPGNESCSECDRPDNKPTWASFFICPVDNRKLGVLCCPRCHHLHQAVGEGEFELKGLRDVDDFTKDDIRILEVSGNKLVNAAYEANLKDEKDDRDFFESGYQAYFFEKMINLSFFSPRVYKDLMAESIAAKVRRTNSTTSNRGSEEKTTKVRRTNSTASNRGSEEKRRDDPDDYRRSSSSKSMGREGKNRDREGEDYRDRKRSSSSDSFGRGEKRRDRDDRSRDRDDKYRDDRSRDRDYRSRDDKYRERERSSRSPPRSSKSFDGYENRKRHDGIERRNTGQHKSRDYDDDDRKSSHYRSSSSKHYDDDGRSGHYRSSSSKNLREGERKSSRSGSSKNLYEDERNGSDYRSGSSKNLRSSSSKSLRSSNSSSKSPYEDFRKSSHNRSSSSKSLYDDDDDDDEKRNSPRRSSSSNDLYEDDRKSRHRSKSTNQRASAEHSKRERSRSNGRLDYDRASSQDPQVRISSSDNLKVRASSRDHRQLTGESNMAKDKKKHSLQDLFGADETHTNPGRGDSRSVFTDIRGARGGANDDRSVFTECVPLGSKGELVGLARKERMREQRKNALRRASSDRQLLSQDESRPGVNRSSSGSLASNRGQDGASSHKRGVQRHASSQSRRAQRTVQAEVNYDGEESELLVHQKRIENLIASAPNVKEEIVDALISTAPPYLRASLSAAIKSNYAIIPASGGAPKTPKTPKKSMKGQRKTGTAWDILKGGRADFIRIAQEELAEREAAGNIVAPDPTGDNDVTFGRRKLKKGQRRTPGRSASSRSPRPPPNRNAASRGEPSRKPKKTGTAWDILKSRRGDLIALAQQELAEREATGNNLSPDENGAVGATFGAPDGTKLRMRPSSRNNLATQ